MPDKYILDSAGRPVLCNDLIEWARWFETSGPQRRVAWTAVGEFKISTIFLGLDLQFFNGPPILYELMVFTPTGEVWNAERYSTREQAEAGHTLFVRAVETEIQLAHYLTIDTLGAIVAELRAKSAPAPAAAITPRSKIHHEARPLGAMSARRRRRYLAYAVRALQLEVGARR